MYVFTPGPAFPRVWPAMLALQRAGARTAQVLQAALAEGRLPAFRPGATAEEIRADLMKVLPARGGEAAAVDALALELHDEAGPIRDAKGVMVIEYPSDAMVPISRDVRQEMERTNRSLGFRGDPPHYALAVPPHL